MVGIVRLLLAGAVIAACATGGSKAAAEDLTRRTGMECTARANISTSLPPDLDARIAALAGPGWIVPERVFAGSLDDLARAIGGRSFGVEDGQGYVNGRLDSDGWVTVIADRAPSTAEAWITTIQIATPCAGPAETSVLRDPV